MDDHPQFQTLEERLAGLPIDRTPHDGVPEWLVGPLREWLHGTLRASFVQELSRRVVLRLKWTRRGNESYRARLVSCAPDDLPRVVDAVLQLHPGWEWPSRPPWDPSTPVLQNFINVVADLIQILNDTGSGYEVDFENHHLTHRMDSTVREAAKQATASASATAAEHLRSAWVAAYGVDPDPDKVFNEAIRAVEEVACPLVELKKSQGGTATLGTTLGELRQNAKWELLLPGKDGQPRDVAHLVGMMELLWEAQVSRHGGAPKSRRQDQTEAEAAVHLAALLVRWLSTGVLRHK